MTPVVLNANYLVLKVILVLADTANNIFSANRGLSTVNPP